MNAHVRGYYEGYMGKEAALYVPPIRMQLQSKAKDMVALLMKMLGRNTKKTYIGPDQPFTSGGGAVRTGPPDEGPIFNMLAALSDITKKNPAILDRRPPGRNTAGVMPHDHNVYDMQRAETTEAVDSVRAGLKARKEKGELI